MLHQASPLFLGYRINDLSKRFAAVFQVNPLGFDEGKIGDLMSTIGVDLGLDNAVVAEAKVVGRPRALLRDTPVLDRHP